jgi:hypothetical protein
MNIFLLSLNLRLCAMYHVDKHVVKMILEAAQVLCTAVWLNGGSAPYKPAHKKHPCTLWCAESLSNWLFLKELCCELNEEFRYRYDKKVNHKSWDVIKELPIPEIPDKGLTPFVQAMPVQYKGEDAVEAYRRYYVGAKHSFAAWSKREDPEWYGPMRDEHVRLHGAQETFVGKTGGSKKKPTKKSGEEKKEQPPAKKTQPRRRKASQVLDNAEVETPEQTPTVAQTTTVETRSMKRKRSPSATQRAKRRKVASHVRAD